MKTLTVLSQKGGAGKTTLALSLAVSAELTGKQTLIVDTDPQASASKWYDRRIGKTDAPYVMSGHAERLPQILQLAKENNADFAIIDTAPHAQQSALQACKVADIVLIPCRASILDLDAIQASVDIVKLSGKTAFVVVNALPPQSQQRYQELREAVPARCGISVLDSYYANRMDFVDATTEGLTPREFNPSGKAAEEEIRLFRWVASELSL